MNDKQLINSRIFTVKKTLCKLEGKRAPDLLIQSYADFLKHRDFLHGYKFNPKVLNSLLDITLDLWTTEARINRLSLLEHIRGFLQKAVQHDNAQPWNSNREINRKLKPDTKERIFELFKMVYEHPSFIPLAQIESARKMTNRMLMNLSLSKDAQIWLCNRAFVNPHVMNRVLRYPEKSPIISIWARCFYDHPLVRARRAEQLGWFLNDKPHHEVSDYTLIEDFESLNKSDLKAIRTFRDELEANKLLVQDFGEFLRPRPRTPNIFDDDDHDFEFGETAATEPELKFARRFYMMESKLIIIDGQNHHVPNIAAAREYFFANLDTIRHLTMIWAACYSKLNFSQKLKIYRKNYKPELFGSYLKIAQQSHDKALLRWLIKVLEKEKMMK